MHQDLRHWSTPPTGPHWSTPPQMTLMGSNPPDQAPLEVLIPFLHLTRELSMADVGQHTHNSFIAMLARAAL